jgi:HprK-related kinase A
LLGERGWRFLGDEFALVDLATGALHPFPRAISLKNEALALFQEASADRLGPILADTPKGRIRHLRPRDDAVARMTETAKPVLILFPRFGRDFRPEVRRVGAAETFVRLTQASTNYVALGEQGFETLSALVTGIPARAIDYSDTESAVALVEQLWNAL